MRKFLEICVENLESAIAAEQGGADRIELCSNLVDGGLTPETDLARKCVFYLNIPIYAMIRPRSGDFCYSDTEIEQMIVQIKRFKKLGVHGFVLGCLTSKFGIHISNLLLLKHAAKPMPITFHRAFDMTSNPHLALQQLIDNEIESVLTSGQKETAIKGKDLILRLLELTGSKIAIIAGSGINPENIDVLASEGIRYFHSSARVHPTDPYNVDIEVVKRMRQKLI